MSNYIKLNKTRRLKIWNGKPFSINYVPPLFVRMAHPSEEGKDRLGWACHPETNEVYLFCRTADGKACAEKSAGQHGDRW